MIRLCGNYRSGQGLCDSALLRFVFSPNGYEAPLAYWVACR